MYIMITSRCNMMCPHCCYSCTAVGKDMQKSIFERAIRMSNEINSPIAIGGGEPTLHPQLWEFIGLALRWQPEPDEMPLWLATNGSNTGDSIQLAQLARAGVLMACLSLDQWHAPIEESVRKAFGAYESRNRVRYTRRDHDLREIRDVGDSVSLQGRAKENQLDSESPDNCVCNDIFVNPEGDVYECGCQWNWLGNIFSHWNVLREELSEMERFTCTRERIEEEIEDGFLKFVKNNEEEL